MEKHSTLDLNLLARPVSAICRTEASERSGAGFSLGKTRRPARTNKCALDKCTISICSLGKSECNSGSQLIQKVREVFMHLQTTVTPKSGGEMRQRGTQGQETRSEDTWEHQGQ